MNFKKITDLSEEDIKWVYKTAIHDQEVLLKKHSNITAYEEETVFIMCVCAALNSLGLRS